ncbi:MAG: peptidoglycan DD-metalloendopeptidase family protein [Planctomycetota bacterium]|jgi:hypothetical protein
MRRTLSVLLTATVSLTCSHAVAETGGLSGGGPYGQQTQPCLTAADWAHAARAIADYEKRFGPLSGGTAMGEPPLFPFYPMGGTLYGDLWISNFVDLDPTSGLLDWDCTDYTYNGHDASDTILRSFGEQEIGVPILAALDGLVVGTHDGEEDHNTTWEGQPANYVIIDHGFGRVCYYWHMRKWSVAVETGEQVKAGHVIGMAASSGNSNYPHLHFATYDGNVLLEPWAGACRPGPSAWESQVPIDRDLYLWDFGITRENMFEYDGPPYTFPRGGQVVLSDQRVYFWTMALNFPAMSTWRVRFERPSGSFAYDSGTRPFNNPSFYRFSWWWWWYNITDMHSIPGKWHIWLYLNGNLMVVAPVEVRPDEADIANRAPEPITASLEPASPTVDDVIFCRTDTSLVLDDDDYDIVRYEYAWTVNGAEVRNVTTAAHADALPHHTACDGAVVHCAVTPRDEVDAGPSSAASVVLSGDRGDLDCDGAIGIGDLLDLLGAWGPCADCDNCPADLNGDCTVGIGDLLILLANWG